MSSTTCWWQESVSAPSPSGAVPKAASARSQGARSLIVVQLCASHIAARQALMTRPYPMVTPHREKGNPPGVSALFKFRLTNSFSLVGWSWWTTVASGFFGCTISNTELGSWCPSAGLIILVGVLAGLSRSRFSSIDACRQIRWLGYVYPSQTEALALIDPVGYFWEAVSESFCHSPVLQLAYVFFVHGIGRDIVVA